MLIASLDTSTLTLSCALCEHEGQQTRVLAEATERAPARPASSDALGRGRVGHGGRLPGALVDLLLSIGRQIHEIDGYAIGLGPGSFTGLRIGLATFKGLAYASQRAIAGASSLAAMAFAAAHEAGEGDVLVPLLDAKKGELYAGFYRRCAAGVQQVLPEAALEPDALVERLASLALGGARPVLFGEGLAAQRAAVGEVSELRTGIATPPAFAVARLCAGALAGAPYDSAKLFALEPHYLRASEAEIKFPRGLWPGATGS